MSVSWTHETDYVLHHLERHCAKDDNSTYKFIACKEDDYTDNSAEHKDYVQYLSYFENG